MKKLGFILDGMTYLKYYIPLIEEATLRGLSSAIFVSKSNKYNCPFAKDHLQILKSICKARNVALFDHDEKLINSSDIVFTVEGTKIHSIDKSKIFSLCCSTDFTASYEKYVDVVSHVVMSSQFVAGYYGKISDKNLYLGTPKFDVQIDVEEVKKKYGLADDKYVTIFYPRLRDIGSAPVRKIAEDMKKLGYKVLLKTRGKDPIQELDITRFNFEDVTWHPHTSLELIKASELIVNFSSSVIEETTALQVPLVNFHVKPFTKPFKFLYDFSFVQNLNTDYSFDELAGSTSRLTTTNFSKDFSDANDKLFDTRTSSRDIINKIV